MSSPGKLSNPDDGSHSETSLVSDDDALSPSNRERGAPRAIGVLPSGDRFSVPETLSIMETLVDRRSWTSPATVVWALACLATAALVPLHLSRGWFPKWCFCLLFITWRLAYNLGLGLLLRRQSNTRWFLELYRRAVKPNALFLQALKRSVVLRREEVPYDPANFPDEFNAWMVFRFLVMLVLALDVVSYVALVAVYWERAPDVFSLSDMASYLVGLGLILFALWSKADAHRVIGDYAWYWGDFFFLLDKHLVFDGIFQMFPHPMYTVGYAFMYGVPLMAKSYTVFYLSLFGHVCQFLFLALVENPHIDKTYNALAEPTPQEKARDELLYGEEKGYFASKDMVVVKNFDPFRSSDVLLVVLLVYLLVTAFVLDVPLWFHVGHYVCWRLFHNGVLGWVLHVQSTQRKWTHHWGHKYGTPREAFNNWKRVFNTSVVMTNLSYAVCAWKLSLWTSDLIDSSNQRVLVLILGLLLVGLNVYVSRSAYEVVGDYGFFYGDFFIDDVPSSLNYSGIYRYLNNPDSTLGFSGYYGIALMSGNVMMLPLAVFSHGCAKLFEVLVEKPHMDRKYGRSVRAAGGLRTEMKKKSTALREKLSVAKAEYEVSVNRLREEMEKKKAEFEATQQALRRRLGSKKKA